MVISNDNFQLLEPIMVSALEHYSYCPRQFALIHVEQSYDENIFTLRGSADHERVDEGYSTASPDIRVESSLPIWSERLGLIGKADIVEFHGDTPYPIEYKHGPRKMGVHAEMQLCAQAMCLEEMFGCCVPKGSVYHCSSHHRREVVFSEELRTRAESMLVTMRAVLESGDVPEPVNDARCTNCSLIDLCLPQAVGKRRRLSHIGKALFEANEEE
ncbi:MAG: CRISPR-associated protein Cas4 [Gaiellales bacterium]|nr:MAG: CRISPR-associated protein Cas4 [Gaiellales bacterium]